MKRKREGAVRESRGAMYKIACGHLERGGGCCEVGMQGPTAHRWKLYAQASKIILI